MDFSTAFKIVTQHGLMVYTLVKGNRAYIAIAKVMERRLSDRELDAKNTDIYIRYSNTIIDGIKYLQKVDVSTYYTAGLVDKSHEKALKKEWITQAQNILAIKNHKKTA